MEVLTNVRRDIVERTIFLTHRVQHLLELRSLLLLLLRIVNIRFLEVTLHPWCLTRHLVVDLLLLLRVIQLRPLLTLQEEEVCLDIVVGKSLLTSQSCHTRDDAEDIDDDGGNDDVLLCIGNTQPREFQVVMDIETVHQSMIDGDKPCEACHTVEDTTQTTLLTRHTSQLSVCAVEDVSKTKHQDSDDVHHQSVGTLIVETAASKEEGAGCSDDHREDGDSIRVYVEFGKKHRPPIAERTYHMQVEPVLRLSRFKGLLNLFVHVPI